MILVIIFGISSCAAKKITVTKNTEIVEINKSSTIISKAEAEAKKRFEDSIARKAQAFDIENTTKDNVISNSNTNTSIVIPKVLNNDPNRIHKIAVILPFNLNQIPLGQYVDDSTKQLSIESRNAVEFYLGCQMAKDRFQSQNLKTNVYFLDEPNDEDDFAAVFSNKPFPNIDYIVGTINEDKIMQTAQLAKSNQIPVLLPFSTSISIKGNSYVFNARPSLISQYKFILNDIKTKYPTKTIEVVYDGSDDSLSENINRFKDLVSQIKFPNSIEYNSLSISDDIASKMREADTLNQRVVLIYSLKDTYVKSVLVKLKLIKNDLQIFTSSCARNTKNLVDAKYPHDIFTTYPYRSDGLNNKIFVSQFEDKYQKKPTEIACQAYDIMMHLFNLLDRNQNLQYKAYNFSMDFDNTHTKFQFEPVLDKNGNIDFYDNQFMYLYKYVAGNFTILSDN